MAKIFSYRNNRNIKKGETTFDGIMQLQKILETKLETLGSRSANAKKVVEYLYTQPVIGVNKIEEIIEKSNVTAYKLIADLEKLEILKKFREHKETNYMFLVIIRFV